MTLCSLRALTAILLLSSKGVQAQAPVPPPVEQLTADCANETYATDMLVCAEADLKSLDSEMAESLRVADPDVIRGVPPLLESQRDWFRRRSRCAFEAEARGCTTDAYIERVAMIRAAATRRNDPGFSCRLSTGRSAVAWLLPGGALVVRDAPQLIAVAVPKRRGQWTAYAVWAEDKGKRTIAIISQNGGKATCKRPK